MKKKRHEGTQPVRLSDETVNLLRKVAAEEDRTLKVVAERAIKIGLGIK